MKPDIERVKQYVFSRLKDELPPSLVYHDLAHTQDNVLPAAARLAALTGINDTDLLLLRTAALFHDFGYVEQYDGHEAVGVRIATETLPGFGYSPDHIQDITEIIMATKMPQTPKGLLGELLADADLDVLGRDDFMGKNHCLRLELEAQGVYHTNEEWDNNQINFLESHSYFTRAARDLRTKKKQENIETFKALLQDYKTPG